jgi:hypothetical protein
MKQREYEVDICEVLKKTIIVKATNKEEAHQAAETEWADGQHILDYGDYADVHFIVKDNQKDRGFER